MFDSLTGALQNAYRALVGQKTLTEDNIDEGIRAVRQALLEADVNFKVAKGLIQDVRQRAVGAEIIKSVNPGDQFVKIFHDALTALLGGTWSQIPPSVHSAVTCAFCSTTAAASRRRRPSPTPIPMAPDHGPGRTTSANSMP